VAYIEDPQKLLESVEAVVIATEWPQYQELNYRGKIVVDRRRVERGQERKKLCRYSDLLPALKDGFLCWGLRCQPPWRGVNGFTPLCVTKQLSIFLAISILWPSLRAMPSVASMSAFIFFPVFIIHV
jgi:hypothetical protein